MSDSEIYNAEISEDWMLAEGRRPSGKFFKNTTVATILALIFVSSTTLYFFLDEEAIDYGIVEQVISSTAPIKKSDLV